MGGVTRFADVDAVTIDGYGTLLSLNGVVERAQALAASRPRADVERAVRAEASYYLEHAEEARDEQSVTRLHRDCAAVFNRVLATNVSVAEFNAIFVFDVIAGVTETLAALRARGLALGVVANWDYSVHRRLEEARLTGWFDTVVVSAEVGARKPDPLPFRVALERLRARPERAVHVGDHRPHDEVGALAAGMRFAAAPLATAFEGWA